MKNKYGYQAEDFESKPMAERVRVLRDDVDRILFESEELSRSQLSVLEEIEVEIAGGETGFSKEMRRFDKALLFLRRKLPLGERRKKKILAGEARKIVNRKLDSIEQTAGRELRLNKEELENYRLRSEKEIWSLQELEGEEGFGKEMIKDQEKLLQQEKRGREARAKTAEERLAELLKGFKAPALDRQKSLSLMLEEYSGAYQAVTTQEKRLNTTVRKYKQALSNIESPRVIAKIVVGLAEARTGRQEIQSAEAALKERIKFLTASKTEVDGFIKRLREIGNRRAAPPFTRKASDAKVG